MSIFDAAGHQNRGCVAREGLVERCRKRAIRSRLAKTSARVERMPFCRAWAGLGSAAAEPGKLQTVCCSAPRWQLAKRTNLRLAYLHSMRQRMLDDAFIMEEAEHRCGT